MSIFNISLSLLLPLVLNLIFIPIILTVAHTKGIYDFTDARKTHAGQIPRLGGIGIFLSLMISVIIINSLIKPNIPIPFYIALSLVFICGLVDDFKPVKPIVKLLTQIVATLILFVGGINLSHVFIPFVNITIEFGIFSYPITLIWIIGITNAINLLDGMDGQAGGVTTIATLSFAILSLLLGLHDISILCFISAGAIIGFLCFNLPPAKIFMGDSGSLNLGFLLASIPLMFSGPTIKGKIILTAIALLIIPILDVFAAIIRRKKDKRSFFTPDRGHIHHKFSDLTSLNTRQILIVIYSLCISSAIFAMLFMFKTSNITSIGLIINLVIHLLIFNFLHNRKKRDKNL